MHAGEGAHVDCESFYSDVARTCLYMYVYQIYLYKYVSVCTLIYTHVYRGGCLRRLRELLSIYCTCICMYNRYIYIKYLSVCTLIYQNVRRGGCLRRLRELLFTWHVSLKLAPWITAPMSKSPSGLVTCLYSDVHAYMCMYVNMWVWGGHGQ